MPSGILSPGRKCCLKHHQDPCLLKSPTLIITSIVLLLASWQMLVPPYAQRKTQNSPSSPQCLGYPALSEETLEVDRTVFPSPNEVIVLEISPGSLLKETTGWGQRQFLLPAACCLASSWIFLRPLPPFLQPPAGTHPLVGAALHQGGEQPVSLVTRPHLWSLWNVRKEFGVWTSLSDWD